jgi:hypothetical protein
MARTASLAERWPTRGNRSARVQTLNGHWIQAEVRSSRPAAPVVEHVLVLQSDEGGSMVGVPIRAVSGRFLRVAAKGDRPGMEFGPVDVAVLRGLVLEAAGQPA